MADMQILVPSLSPLRRRRIGPKSECWAPYRHVGRTWLLISCSTSWSGPLVIFRGRSVRGLFQTKIIGRRQNTCGLVHACKFPDRSQWPILFLYFFLPRSVFDLSLVLLFIESAFLSICKWLMIYCYIGRLINWVISIISWLKAVSFVK